MHHVNYLHMTDKSIDNITGIVSSRTNEWNRDADSNNIGNYRITNSLPASRKNICTQNDLQDGVIRVIIANHSFVGILLSILIPRVIDR